MYNTLVVFGLLLLLLLLLTVTGYTMGMAHLKILTPNFNKSHSAVSHKDHVEGENIALGWQQFHFLFVGSRV
jgi:hypothetical protein